jgi:putative ABC transport system permease protein
VDIGPILSTLKRHRVSSALIIAEIMLACAILCNAMDLIAQRVARLYRQTGFAESELVLIGIQGIGIDQNTDALTQQDLAVLRRVPGVRQATTVNQMPYGGTAWNSEVQGSPGPRQTTLRVSQYAVGEHFLEAGGVQLVAGRSFQPDELVDESAQDVVESRALSILVNEPMARQLFPDGGALGKTIYQSNRPLQIVGIVGSLSAPRQSQPDYPAMVTPLRLSYSRGGIYLLRVDPAQRRAVLAAATATLLRENPNRVILKQDEFVDVKKRSLAPDVAMCWLLVGVCSALLVVTALGIVGLASFWVQQRARMIGTRRALGATRRQILRYFQVENLLLTSFGIGLGMLGAYGINQVLMTYYELTRLPIIYLPVGAVVVIVLGQVAVLGPALRGAALSPTAIMRTA